MNRTLRKAVVAGLAASTLLFLLVLSGITIPLGFLGHRLEFLAGHLLDRKVSIHGSVRLQTSLHPSLTINGLTVGNPRDWNGKNSPFLSVEYGQARISLSDLLRGDIRIESLEFTGVDLQLVTHSDRSSNYQFTSGKQGTDTEKASTEHELTGLDRISLRDIQLSYHDELSGKQYDLVIDEAHGQGMPGEPLQFSLMGQLSQQTCTLAVTGGTLQSLIKGKESWPLSNGKLTFGDVSLDLKGALERAEGDISGNLALSLAGHSLESIGTILDLPLPDVGDFSLHTGIALKPGMFQFTAIQLDAMSSSLTGDLIFSLHGKRPTLAGSIHLDTLESQSFPALQQDTQKEKSDSPTMSDFQKIPWQLLHAMDSDLHVEVGHIAAGGLGMDGLKSVISLVDGDLFMPFSLGVEEIPASGHVEVLTGRSVPFVKFDFAGKSSKLDPLLAALAGEQKLQGKIGSISLQSRSKGKSLFELIKGLDLTLRIGESSLQNSEITLVAVSSLSLLNKPGEPFSLLAEGELLGSPLKIDASIGKTEDRKNNKSSLFNLQLTACNTEIDVDATRKNEKQGKTDFHFNANGEQLCGFLVPVTEFLGGGSGFSVRSRGNVSDKGAELQLDHFQLGLQEGEDGKPKLGAVLHSEKNDLRPLLSKQNSPADIKTEASDGQAELEQKIALLKKLLTMDIVPDIKLFAADIKMDIDLEQLNTGHGEVSDIKFSALIEEGKLQPSPFQATIGGNTFVGSAAIDRPDTIPSMNLKLKTDDFNLSSLLKELQVEKAPNITVGHVGLDLLLKGNTILEMLHHSSYGVNVRNGRWQLDRESKVPLVINVNDADFTTHPGKSSVLALKGDINSQPLDVTVTGDNLFTKGTTSPMSLDIQAALVDTDLHIKGQINRKESRDTLVQLSTMLSGSSLDNLNELFGISLPPLGPYEITGTLGVDRQQTINLREMGVKVGESTLHGEMALSGTKKDDETMDFPLMIRTKLNAETIQLADFQLGEWSPVTESLEEEALDDEKEGEEDPGKLHDLFSAELGEKVNAILDIEVGEVLSGRDRLGSGLLKARLENGAYLLDSLHFALPGGDIKILGSLQPVPEGIRGELSMDVSHFDYGVLARRIVPESELKGEVNLSVDVHSRAAGLLQLREHMNGQLRFGVVPEEYQAGILDLWAVNIITAVLPALMNGSSSEVNCLAGDFVLEDGLMSPDIFLLDTSNMRVQGKGEVDFKTNTIDFHLNPTPKSAHFFSLATPITISGTIIEPEIGVTAAGVVGTVFRQATSVVAVPFQWLLTENLEEDGVEACGAAMKWVQGSEKNQFRK